MGTNNVNEMTKVKCCKIYPTDKYIDGYPGMHIIVRFETQDYVIGWEAECWCYYFVGGDPNQHWGWGAIRGGNTIGKDITGGKYRKGDKIVVSKKASPVLRFYNAEIELEYE